MADLGDNGRARRTVDRTDDPAVSLADPITLPGREILAAS
jgi:hypothetical protein